MLTLEIQPNGGLHIQGTERDLRELASWLLLAASHGDATAAFVTDVLTSLRIERIEP